MRTTHLHSFSGDRPDDFFKIEFSPSRMTQLARALHKERKELECKARCRLPLKGVYRPQKSAQRLRVSDRGAWRDRWSYECTLKCVCRIVVRDAVSHRVAKNRTKLATQPPRRFIIPFRLDLAKALKDYRRVDFRDGL